jgi:hypothetical protein
MPILDVDPADPNLSVPSTDWIKQGRADAIADPATRLMFLDLVLEPLLQVSQQYGDVIYAWELINEPEWPDVESQHRFECLPTDDQGIDGSHELLVPVGFSATRRQKIEFAVGASDETVETRANETEALNFVSPVAA